MAKEQSYYDITFNVKGDGQVTAKIEGMYTQFRSLETILKKISQIESKREKTRTGTVNYYNQQIKLIQQERDAFANTTKAYKDATQAMDKLAMMRDKLTGAEREAKAPMAGTVAAYRQQITELRSLQQTLAKTPEKYKEFEDEINKVKTSLNGLTGSIRMSRKPNQDMISNAGLAGATLTELGRTISDLPYGIRGIANNLSQLSTLFVTLVSKTEGGMIPALKGLWKQLNGPLGIVLAFQAVIAALDFFADSQDKAKKEVKGLSQALLDQTTIIQDIFEQFELQKGNDEERLKLIRAIAAVDKDLAKALKDNIQDENKLNEIIAARKRLTDANVAVEKSNVTLKEQILDVEEKRAKAQARIDELNDLEDKKINLHNAQIRERGELRKRLIELEAEGNRLSALKIPLLAEQTAAQKQYDEITGKNNKKEVEHSDILRDLQDELTLAKLESFDKERKAAEFTLRDTKEKIEEDYKDKKISHDEYIAAKLVADNLYAQELKRIQGEENDWRIENAEDNLREAEQLQKKFDKRKENDSRNQLKKTKDFFRDESIARKKALDKDKLTKKEYADAVRKIEADLLQDQIDVIQMAISAGNIMAQQGLDVIRQLEERLASLTGGTKEEDKGETAEQKAKREAKRRKELLKLADQFITELNSLFDLQFDADISREERKTVLLNNQLRERLNNENLSAKQKESINAQIAKNEENLQKKRDQLAEKQFKIQKAISMTQALMTTFEMGNRAFNAVLAGPEKFLGMKALTLAKIAKGAAIATGLLQVRAIAKQQFVPSAIGSGGGSSSSTGGNVQAPDFNIVGQSQTNQLAQAVSGQLNKPVKAYIVAKDVSTAQEMDRNKVEAASL